MRRARALSLAMVLMTPAGLAAAQSPWPSSPTEPSAPASAAPWPSSPTTPQAAPGAAWPSSPVAPQTGMPQAGPTPWSGGAAPRRDCGAEFTPLRADAEKRAGMIKAAAAKKSQPELCNAFKNFAAAEAKMLKFVVDNGANCGIPPDAAKTMKANHGKTIGIRDRVCSANAAAAAPRAPSLSDALGTSSRLPDTSNPQAKGGGTFNTLTGNAIAR